MYSHQSESFPNKPICSYVFVSSSQLTTTDFQLPGNFQSVDVTKVTPLQGGDVFKVVSVHDGEVLRVTKVLAINYLSISANLYRSLLVILLAEIRCLQIFVRCFASFVHKFELQSLLALCTCLILLKTFALNHRCFV